MWRGEQADLGHARRPATAMCQRWTWTRRLGPAPAVSLGAAVGLPLLALCAFAVLFVGWDVLISRLYPELSTGLRHALLTAWAVVVAFLTAWAVYLLMRRQQRRLAATAERLARLLESYKSESTANGRFENPHLVHCRDLLDCTHTECPMHNTPGERCWQLVGLDYAGKGQHVPEIDLHQCYSCAVYRASCPDELTELGESFNNLMFLLEEERAQTQRMRAHMVEKQKMVAIGQMAAGVAHEIGNPLSSISSIAQMLRRGGISDAQSAQVDLIETHVQRISTIVRQLSRLSRPSVAQWEPVDIGQVLDEAVRLISFDRRSRDIEIDLVLPPKPLPSTYGLRGELQQVFINLSLNAMDAMEEGGRLTVRAEQNLRHIAVHIKDTGKGIAEDIGRRVFDPFFTTKQPGEGTGLGLAVSYNIVQKHGGTIDFVSAAGEGTEFTVLVPRLDEPPETASAVAAVTDRASAEDHEEP